jgi:hypothetical protein
MCAKRKGGLLAAVLSCASSGSDSSQGKVSATPAPRKKLRRDV